MLQHEGSDQPDTPTPDAARDQSAEDFHGESLVGEALRSCVGPDCYIVHDVDAAEGGVEHIEVNPGGVFTIESAAHEGESPAPGATGGTLLPGHPPDDPENT